jgi:predicted component of type VI protein secretion system
MSESSLSDSMSGSISTSMLEISISGPNASQRLQKALRDGQVVRLGRAPKEGWAVPWDRAISREHADIHWQNGQLNISMLPTATNPIVYRNKMMKELTIAPGDWFQIGETKFQAGALPNERLQQELMKMPSRTPSMLNLTRESVRSWRSMRTPRTN